MSQHINMDIIERCNNDALKAKIKVYRLICVDVALVVLRKDIRE